MPGTPTTKYALPTMAGADLGNTIDDWTVAFGAAVDSKLAPSDQGAFASRPVSTGGSPGKSGRTYFATDTGVLYRDNGTGWDTVLTGVGQAALLGLTADGVVRRGKSIVATTQSSTNAAYAFLTTPDRVQNVVLPTDGLIMIAYQAIWQQSAINVAKAAIVIGSSQLKVAGNSGAAAAQEAALSGGAAIDTALATFPGGLVSSTAATATSNVTTGQVVGIPASGGACAVFAAAGTYDVGVQFQALLGGTVTVKDRRLWVWTIGF